MIWNKDRRGLESALHCSTTGGKEVFSQTAANPNHLPHRQLVHSDFTFSTGSCRGRGELYTCRCRYRSKLYDLY